MQEKNSLQDKIDFQINAGFSTDEIYENLSKKGYTNKEIKDAIKTKGSTSSYSRRKIGNFFIGGFVLFAFLGLQNTSSWEYNNDQKEKSIVFLVIAGICFIIFCINLIKK